jgi:hypothetical protein
LQEGGLTLPKEQCKTMDIAAYKDMCEDDCFALFFGDSESHLLQEGLALARQHLEEAILDFHLSEAKTKLLLLLRFASSGGKAADGSLSVVVEFAPPGCNPLGNFQSWVSARLPIGYYFFIF